jgi:pimeloyl-ACP methyl ester carboxylesterase
MTDRRCRTERRRVGAPAKVLAVVTAPGGFVGRANARQAGWRKRPLRTVTAVFIAAATLAAASGCTAACGKDLHARTTTGCDARASGTAQSLAGDWMLKLEPEPGFAVPFVLHLSTARNGDIGGAVDNPAAAEYGVPLRPIAVNGRAVSTTFGDLTLKGTVDGSDRISGSASLRGIFSDVFAWVLGINTRFSFTMTRGDGALPLRPQSASYDRDGHHIHYMEVAGSTAARIVFVHGSPGEWDNFGPFLVNAGLQRRATLVAMDRPGFGDSDPGRVVPDLRAQARLLEPLLRGDPALAGSSSSDAADPRGPTVPTILVGWSLGGPIAAEMAMDYPDEVQALVLIAPAIDPQNDGARWYNHAASVWPIGRLTSWLLGPENLWSNEEMLPLGRQLQAMLPRWRSLRMPVVVIQGGDDHLVSPHTADFAQQVLPPGNRVIRLPHAGHVGGWAKAALDTLDGLLDRVRPVSAPAAQRQQPAGSLPPAGIAAK